MTRKLMTKRDILERLKVLGVKANSKSTKGDLQKLLRASEKRKAEKREAAKRNSKVTARKSVRVTLFEMYSQDKDLALSKDELLAALPGRKWSSITTWIGKGGLGNPKYAVKVDGVPQPILIERGDDDRYRRTS